MQLESSSSLEGQSTATSPAHGVDEAGNNDDDDDDDDKADSGDSELGMTTSRAEEPMMA